jgi:hypothetical protein
MSKRYRLLQQGDGIDFDTYMQLQVCPTLFTPPPPT